MAQWRLGIDLGTNSLGWAAVTLDAELEPCGLKDWGVRIFPDGRDPQKGESLAVERRTARGMRRNRDRKQRRVRRFAGLLEEFGLSVATDISPYAARDLAARKPVDAPTLGRALLHLCRRRGFQSNRIADSNDKETGNLKVQMNLLQAHLDATGSTLGQFLYERLLAGEHVRFRGGQPVTITIDGKPQPVYPKRSMYMDEFQTIRDVQGNTLLSDEQWNALETGIAFQRPLMRQAVGRCTFEEEERGSRHLPISQTFRIVQEANNLRYLHRGTVYELTQEQRTALINALQKQKTLAFSAIRTKLLKLPRDSEFNLESLRRKELDGNTTAFSMRKLFAEHEMDWDTLSPDRQNSLVQCILEAQTREDFDKANVSQGWNLSASLLDACYGVHFPSSIGHLSVTAMQKLLPHMLTGMQYWDAATTVYGSHTAQGFETGEVLPELPYYGRVLQGATTPIRACGTANEDEIAYGRIPNPTVHVALNQLRQVVNALIARHGNPYQIHIELARDLKIGKKRKAEIEKEIATHTKEADRRKKELIACGIPNPSPADLLKMRLWEELADAGETDSTGGMMRIDIYTGKPMSLRQCMSDEVEIEHILPFSRTYDNTSANKTVTFRQTNRDKGNATPAEYMLMKGEAAYTAMLERARQRLRKSKQWRFNKDAMDIFERAVMRQLTAEEKAEYLEGGTEGLFIARQLKDTQYMARTAARYLVPVVGSSSRIIPVNGGVTSILRNKWKLDFAKKKGTDEERNDHRHHAVDALVVALTSRSMLQRIARATSDAQNAAKDYRAKLFVPMPQWLAHGWNEMKHLYGQILISFRQDHSRESKLYQETAYGLLAKDDPAFKEGYNAVFRRAITGLKESELSQIRDAALRAAIVDATESPEYHGLKWEAKLGKLQQEGVLIGNTRQLLRRVRIVVKNQSIRRIPSARYKGYAPDAIAFCDIWKVPVTNIKRSFTGKFTYQASYVSYVDAKAFEGNEAGLFAKYKPHPAAKRCMRLHKEDMVTVLLGGSQALMRVAGFKSDQRLYLRPHIQATMERQPFSITKLMQENDLRKVHITADGRLMR